MLVIFCCEELAYVKAGFYSFSAGAAERPHWKNIAFYFSQKTFWTLLKIYIKKFVSGGIWTHASIHWPECTALC
jgi:hypothetical protein